MDNHQGRKVLFLAFDFGDFAGSILLKISGERKLKPLKFKY